MKITEVPETGSLLDDAQVYIAQKETQEDGTPMDVFRKTPAKSLFSAFSGAADYIIKVIRNEDETGYVIEGDFSWDEMVAAAVAGSKVVCRVCSDYDVQVFPLSYIFLEDMYAVFGHTTEGGTSDLHVYSDGRVYCYHQIIRELDETLSDRQKAANAYFVGQKLSECVQVVEQKLTDGQKSQARQNIGAIASGDTVTSLAFKDLADTSSGFYIECYGSVPNEDDPEFPHPIAFFNECANDEAVVLRNVHDGINDEDAATVGQVNAAVGDIEAALDSILTIQENLIGFITFTVSNNHMIAVNGMTWSEWCDSQYNTVGVHINDDGIACDGAGDQIVLGDVVQYGTTVIVSGADYVSL